MSDWQQEVIFWLSESPENTWGEGYCLRKAFAVLVSKVEELESRLDQQEVSDIVQLKDSTKSVVSE